MISQLSIKLITLMKHIGNLTLIGDGLIQLRKELLLWLVSLSIGQNLTVGSQILSYDLV